VKIEGKKKQRGRKSKFEGQKMIPLKDPKRAAADPEEKKKTFTKKKKP